MASEQLLSELPRRTAHAVHALLYVQEVLKMPPTASEVCLYDSEALSVRSTAAALRAAARVGLAVFVPPDLWTPTFAAMDQRAAFEERFLTDTEPPTCGLSLHGNVSRPEGALIPAPTPARAQDDEYVASVRDAALAWAAAGELPEIYVRKVVELVERDCADAYREAVKALNRIERVYERTMPGPRDALRDQVLAIIAAYRGQSGPGEATE